MATTILAQLSRPRCSTRRTSTRAPMPWDPISLLMSRFGFGIEARTRAELAAYG